jgi:glucose/mannose-6-phosphate isomerase
MDLNNWQAFKTLDPEDMLSHIDGLPDQLEKAWELGNALPLPAWSNIERVVITGMGGSAIGADLLVAYSETSCTVPVLVHRDYLLPAWAKGPGTLVIASSHSGNTEETLSAFADATQKGCTRLAIATGGALTKAAQEAEAALWTFDHRGQPRAAVGFSFGLLLAAFTRLGLITDPSHELAGAIEAMRTQQKQIEAEVPITQNPAKRQAGQLLDRWVAILGSGILSPVARRWKGQVSELAKAWAQFEFLPEADHNTLAGSLNPAELLAHTVVLFLKSPADHPRNRLRLDYTQKVLMLDGLATDSYTAKGDTPLANLWTALHFGDYMAYYLAMLYEVDPTPVEALQKLKKELSAMPTK